MACVTSDHITIRLPRGTTDTICLDLGELPGEIESIIEICGGGNVSSAVIEPIPGTFCLEVYGLSLGTDNRCFEICDDNGFCDTTYLKVIVKRFKEVPYDQAENPDGHGTEDLSMLIVNNGFSPNGDGVNDFFHIEGLEKIKRYELSIMNRYGKKVFSTQGL